MFKIFLAGLAAVALSGAARAADDDAIVLHLLGDAPAAGENGLHHFVINATASAGDGDYSISGWLSVLPPAAEPAMGSNELKGDCPKKHCDLTVDLDSNTIKITGDLDARAGLVNGKFEIPGVPGGQEAVHGAVTFKPFTDRVPGLGDLVKPEAIDSRTLDDLLMWTGTGHGFIGSDDVHPIDTDEQETLASWQGQNQKPGTGLLFASDLALMISQRADAQKAVGWTPLGGAGLGWSAGYPAKLLPVVSRSGAEQRFASSDGKATLVVAIDAPMGNDEFNTAMEKLINEEVPGQTDRNYALAGDNMQISYAAGGRRMAAYYYRREGGVARLILTYPAPAESAKPGENPLDDIATTIAGSFRVGDAVKLAP